MSSATGLVVFTSPTLPIVPPPNDIAVSPVGFATAQAPTTFELAQSVPAHLLGQTPPRGMGASLFAYSSSGDRGDTTPITRRNPAQILAKDGGDSPDSGERIRKLEELAGTLIEKLASASPCTDFKLPKWGGLGKVAIPFFVEKFQDPAWRVTAVIALGDIGIETPEVVSVLLKALADGNARVRSWAALTSRKMRDPQIVSALVVALKDADEDVLGAAARALGEMGEGAQVAAPALVDALLDEDGTPDRRSAAFSALRAVDIWKDKSTLELEGVILSRDSDTASRVRAVFALAFKEGPEARAALMRALDPDAEPALQAATALALAYRGGPEEAPALIRILSGDRDTAVRANAAFALAKIGERIASKEPSGRKISVSEEAALPVIVSALKKLLQDPNEDVTVLAQAVPSFYSFLIRHLPKEAVSAYVTLLRRAESARLRSHAASMLGNILGPCAQDSVLVEKAVSALATALKEDTDEDVRLNLAGLLSKLDLSITMSFSAVGEALKLAASTEEPFERVRQEATQGLAQLAEFQRMFEGHA